MKYFKKMSAEEFGKYLLTVPFGKEICFALDCEDDELEIPMGQEFDADYQFNFGCWYFIKGISIPEYNSRFLLCDYAGGEEAFAIPVSCYGQYPTMEDKEFVPRFWKQCWEYIQDRRSQQDYLFVEIVKED